MTTKIKLIADDAITAAHLDSSASPTFTNLILTGNLTVQGTTTTLDTTNLNVEDKNITLNYGTGDTSSNADGAGLTIQDAVNGSTDATITWVASSDEFAFSHPASIVNAVGGDTVLNLAGSYGSGNNVALLGFARNGGAVAGDIRYTDATTDMEIGTSTAHGFSLKTSNTKRLTVLSGGNVGIGTTSPATELQIGDYTDNAETLTFATASDQTGRINFYNANASEGASIRVTGGGQGAKMYFANRYNTDADKVTFDLVNGRVGIGETGPAYPLHVDGTNVLSGGGLANLCLVDRTAYNGTLPGAGITFRGEYTSGGNTTNFATIQGIKENTSSGNYATALRFTTRANGGNLTERMRIDSAGTLLVGTSDGSGAGLEISKIHGVRSTVTNNVAALFDRLSSDGEIALFRHDGSTDGQINTLSGRIAIGSGNTGLFFDSIREVLTPHTMTGNTYSANIDLGRTAIPFKDLHLSGGIQFDSRANYLDDYEEGTYTATISCASGSITLNTSFNALRYTKVGRQVHVQGTLAVSSVSSPSGATYLNLPFTSGSDTKRSGNADNVISGYFNGSAITNGIYTIYGNIPESSSTNRLFVMPGHQNSYATYNLGDNFSAGGTDYYVNFTYTT